MFQTDATMYAAIAIGIALACLSYGYVVYPWLVSSLPARTPRPARTTSPSVSIVLAARNAGAALAVKVGELRAADGDAEIVVVLDGPDINASEALRAVRDDRVILIELPHPLGKAQAINAGVSRSSGSVLVMTDARQRVARDAIPRLLNWLVSPDIGAVSGALQIRRSGRATLLDWYWVRERRLRAAEAAFDSAVGVSGALYAIKREYWRPLRPGLLLDDVAVGMEVVKAGARVAFAADAIVEDVPLGDESTEFARKVRTLTGNFQYVAWNPWTLLPWRNRIWWQFVSHKLFRLLTPLATATVLVGLAFFGSVGVAMVGSLVAAVLLATLLSGRTRLGNIASLAHVLRSAAMLHLALVLAAVNAVRGHWDVWTDPKRPTFGVDT